MTADAANPFRLAKSLDLSDERVERYWVNFENMHGPSVARFYPAAPMPTIILGGKGSGKSHLLRYHFEEGREARLARVRGNWRTLVEGLRALGFETVLRDEVAAPAIAPFIQLASDAIRATRGRLDGTFEE